MLNMIVQDFEVLQDLRMIAHFVETGVLDLVILDGTEDANFLHALENQLLSQVSILRQTLLLDELELLLPVFDVFFFEDGRQGWSRHLAIVGLLWNQVRAE